MGEKVEEEKKSIEGEEKKAEEVADKAAKADGGGEKKPAAEGGEKKEDTANVVVLKLDLHCEGCAKKSDERLPISKVKTETSANKLIVTGNIDPALLQEKVQSKTKKKVDLISPTPAKKESGAGDKKSDQKSEKKLPEKKAEKPKQPMSATVVLKMRLHCEGCAHKIKRTIIKNSEGIESVNTDLQNNTITLTGTMNVAELAGFLQEKLKRGVEIVPPAKKNGGGGGGDKKEEAGGGAGDKKGKEKKEEKKAAETGAGDGGDGGGSKAELNKMDYASFNPYTYYAMPMYNSHSYSTGSYAPSSSNHGYYIGDEYPNRGYPLHGRTFPPPPPVAYVNGLDDRMFSDENPNACSIM